MSTESWSRTKFQCATAPSYGVRHGDVDGGLGVVGQDSGDEDDGGKKCGSCIGRNYEDARDLEGVDGHEIELDGGVEYDGPPTETPALLRHVH